MNVRSMYINGEGQLIVKGQRGVKIMDRTTGSVVKEVPSKCDHRSCGVNSVPSVVNKVVE